MKQAKETARGIALVSSSGITTIGYLRRMRLNLKSAFALTGSQSAIISAQEARIMTSEQIANLMQDFCDRMNEHGDCIQILFSKTDASGTSIIKAGAGNFYARLGIAREFIQTDSHRDLASEIAGSLEDNED